MKHRSRFHHNSVDVRSGLAGWLAPLPISYKWAIWCWHIENMTNSRQCMHWHTHATSKSDAVSFFGWHESKWFIFIIIYCFHKRNTLNNQMLHVLLLHHSVACAIHLLGAKCEETENRIILHSTHAVLASARHWNEPHSVSNMSSNTLTYRITAHMNQSADIHRSTNTLIHSQSNGQLWQWNTWM